MLALAALPVWREVELRAFDWLTVLFPVDVEAPIVVVGIDEPSFAEIKAQWPWPRAIHAQLVDRLREAGARVVVFDLLFSEPSSRAGDDATLAAAIRKAGNVVLASDLATFDTRYGPQSRRVEPLPSLLEAGAVAGLLGLPLDRDGVIRRLPTAPDALWRVVLERLAPSTHPPVPRDNRSLIRFPGPSSPVQYVSYSQALDPAALPAGTFRDRIVVVGLNVRTSPDPGAGRPDTFRTPTFVWTGVTTAGVEIQAAAIATMHAGVAVRETPRTVTFAIIAVIGGLSVLLMREWRPLASALRAALTAVTLGGVVVVAFTWGGLWLPALAPVVGLAVTYVAEGGVAFLREQALRARLRGAFGHYVSPHIVEQLIAQPDSLQLGGERKELSIIFCDLAGFTTLSEGMEPEAVVALLNDYLTGVTEAVMAQGGTVDKFLGDGLVAFWNAPMADPDHALHACRAAEAMQASVARLRDRLVSEGRPPIAMRIGIHTGPVVVGNMGSTTRFDYTASGDNMNLASRIEGVNKVYGTGILLSEATAAALQGRRALRPIDRVRVKGKHRPVDLFTPCDDERLTQLTTEAVAAYRARDWDRSEVLWKEVESTGAADHVPEVYLTRIAGFRSAPPPPDWDGGATLTEK